jgi:hypothetical protein
MHNHKPKKTHYQEASSLCDTKKKKRDDEVHATRRGRLAFAVRQYSGAGLWEREAAGERQFLAEGGGAGGNRAREEKQNNGGE